MSRPLSLRGNDHPPVDPPLLFSRGGLAERVIQDLLHGGVALLQGPAGSGCSWAAMEVARSWDGPVVWTRPGLWSHLSDLCEPLWDGPPPEAVQRGTRDALIDAILAVLWAGDVLWVLDDVDAILDHPAAGSFPQDPDLATLLSAADGGALAGTGGAILLTSRRSVGGISAPVRPLPPLGAAEGALCAGREGWDLPRAWLRRPGALDLLKRLPQAIAAGEDPGRFPTAAVTALRETDLSDEGAEALLAVAIAQRPCPIEALAEASGLSQSTLQSNLKRLENWGVVRADSEGYACARSVAESAVAVLGETLGGTTPRSLRQRLAGYYLCQDTNLGYGWTSISPARLSRLGLRYAARANDGRMAVQGLLHGGAAARLEDFQAWRALRNDLGVALAADTSELELEDRLQARYALARAAEQLGDGEQSVREYRRVLEEANQVAAPPMLRDIHSRVGRHLLLAGRLDAAEHHLRAALLAAKAEGHRLAQCDLQNSLAGICLQQGELDVARRHYQASLEAAEQEGDARRAASRRAGLGGVLLYEGRLRDAEQLMLQAADDGRKAGDSGGVSQRLLNIALIRSQRGDTRGAQCALVEVLAEAALDDPRLRGRFYGFRANLRRLGGNLDGAEQDLERAAASAAEGGDREAVSELESATGHLCRTRGDFEEAVEAFQRSLEALAPGRDTAVQAARQINACNATVWASAATWLASGQGTVVAVEAAAEAHQALQSIPEGPYFPRFLSASMQVTEAQLLAATLQHTPPVGLLRSLERLLAVAESNPERHPSGEPALRVLEAWGLWLCGQDEPARAAAKRAASDATIAGLSTVQGRAQVFVGKRAQAWNGQARLLSQLLQDRESE